MVVARSFLLGLLALVVVIGCEPKVRPVPIESLKVVTDDARKFEVKVPANWNIQTRKGSMILATSSKSAASRFNTFSKGEGGAKIELRVIPIDSVNPTMAAIIEKSKLEFERDTTKPKNISDSPVPMYLDEATTFGGKVGKKLSVEFDQIDGKCRMEMYFAENDSLVTTLTLAAFGNTFQDYEAEFAEIIKSVKLAQKVVVAPKVDTTAPAGPEPPSTTLRAYAAADFSIKIPDNFQGTKGSSKGLSSMSFAGSRLDCTIQVDVFDAKDQKNLDKIIEQNKARYQGAKATPTTVNGQKAYYFNYAGGAGVGSRAYFTVKGDKMFRITLNWFKDEQAVYLPLFEQCVTSMNLK